MSTPRPPKARVPRHADGGGQAGPRRASPRTLALQCPTGRPGSVPRCWCGDLGEILITERQLARRVEELAAVIARDYAGRELTVVALLKGTLMFLADLLRRLSLPLELDFVGVSSYREGTASRGLVFTHELRLDVSGRDVLVVDDILDTGRTLKAVQQRLRRLKPASLKTCVLLDKPSRRVERVGADYVGFVVPDVFVVGYGLDFAERYRNLPFVGVLRPELYAGPTAEAGADG